MSRILRWKEGEALVIDDSFEHEVWYPATEKEEDGEKECNVFLLRRHFLSKLPDSSNKIEKTFSADTARTPAPRVLRNI